MNKKSTHPFAPEIPEGATKLIIGTMPPYRFCNTDEMLTTMMLISITVQEIITFGSWYLTRQGKD